MTERSARTAAAIGFPWQEAVALALLADRLFALGRIDEAAMRGRESLAVSSRIGDREDTVYALARLAVCAAKSGRSSLAGTLWGAVEAEELRVVFQQWPGERHDFEAELPDRSDEFERGRIDGRRLSLDEAVELALAP